MKTAEAVTPEERVYNRSARLLAVQHAVAENFGGTKVDADPKALRDAVAVFRKAVAAVPDAYGIIIGGLAVQELGYVRWTDDVDVVVDAEHFSEVLAKLRSMGFIIKADMALEFKQSGVRMDCLKEGALLHKAIAPLPHPSELGPNRGYAKLSGLIRLKMGSNRMKDLADIVELLKCNLNKIDSVRDELPSALRKDFLKLAAKARQEVE